MTNPAPGPWHVGAWIPKWSGDGHCTIEDANGKRIATMGDGSENTLGDPEAEATAQMLAAAPDLVAALEEQIKPRARGWKVTDWDIRDYNARAALAKAGAS